MKNLVKYIIVVALAVIMIAVPVAVMANQLPSWAIWVEVVALLSFLAAYLIFRPQSDTSSTTAPVSNATKALVKATTANQEAKAAAANAKTAKDASAENFAREAKKAAKAARTAANKVTSIANSTTEPAMKATIQAFATQAEAEATNAEAEAQSAETAAKAAKKAANPLGDVTAAFQTVMTEATKAQAAATLAKSSTDPAVINKAIQDAQQASMAARAAADSTRTAAELIPSADSASVTTAFSIVATAEVEAQKAEQAYNDAKAHAVSTPHSQLPHVDAMAFYNNARAAKNRAEAESAAVNAATDKATADAAVEKAKEALSEANNALTGIQTIAADNPGDAFIQNLLSAILEIVTETELSVDCAEVAAQAKP